jgi:hypothetical protein
MNDRLPHESPQAWLLTANGIPVSLRPCFQEYTLEKLDPERDALLDIIGNKGAREKLIQSAVELRLATVSA